MFVAMPFNCCIFALWALMCLGTSNVLCSNQYHLQTDEGPERHFVFQTENGQYRREKRLHDGTVIGTDAWISADNTLRLTNYIADQGGYRITNSQIVPIEPGTNIEDAMKFAKASKDGKKGSKNGPNIISHIISTTTTEAPVVGYLSPAEAAKLEPTPYLGFDHYPNELPKEPKRQKASTEISDTWPLLSKEDKRRKISPIAVSPTKPRPIAGNELTQSFYDYPTPKPVADVDDTKRAPNAGYYYEPNTYSQNDQSTQVLPHDVNALEDGLLPPHINLYKRPIVPVQQNGKAAGTNSPTTHGGFRYILPNQYHEEEQFNDNKKAGSYGYVDPFGIRRVVYYNAAPGKGFIHRNHNTYVGQDSQPYDPNVL